MNLSLTVTYPVMMHQISDDKTKREDPLVKNLFFEAEHIPDVAKRPVPLTLPGERTKSEKGRVTPTEVKPISIEKIESGEILSLQKGFGFIKSSGFTNNVFFHWSALTNKDFLELKIVQKVKFTFHEGDKGAVADSLEVLD